MSGPSERGVFGCWARRKDHEKKPSSLFPLVGLLVFEIEGALAEKNIPVCFAVLLLCCPTKQTRYTRQLNQSSVVAEWRNHKVTPGYYLFLVDKLKIPGRDKPKSRSVCAVLSRLGGRVDVFVESNLGRAFNHPLQGYPQLARSRKNSGNNSCVS
jgi:hypothetical protein